MKAGLRVSAAVLLLLTPGLMSCRWFRKTKPIPPPAKIPVQTAPAKPAPPPPLAPPPQIPATQPPTAEIPEQQPEPIPPPPQPVKKRPSPAGPRVQTPPETTAAPAPAPAPQLRPMLTPAQRQELERTLNAHVRTAQAILGSIGNRTLSRDLTELALQIRTFITQAEEAKNTDLLRANNLAERAEVLAQDLSRRLR